MSLNVIALGGNAILEENPTDSGQKEVVSSAAKFIVDFIESGEDVVLCHGNGPQVGNLLLQQQKADSEKNPALNLDTCVAMTQGSIGYWLQNALINEFNQRNMEKTAVSLITQVEVDQDDPAFKFPSKPIGPFLTSDEVKSKKDQSIYLEDAGRGYRKVVPSPLPKKIVEIKAIQALIQTGVVVICAGGGGIPVVSHNREIVGVEAVNDKDFSARILAEEICADRLIILTSVSQVSVNFNKPNQKELETINVYEAKRYIAEGHFAPGSMLPKVQAAVDFVEAYTERKAVITSIENLSNLSDSVGTTIIN